MATLSEAYVLGARQGISKSEMPKFLNDFQKEFGEFEPEKLNWDPVFALRVAKRNVADSLDWSKQYNIKDVLSDEEIIEAQNLSYYNIENATSYNKAEYKAITDLEYPNLTPAQILNENNFPSTYEPWITVQPDRTSTGGEKFRAGLNKSITNFMRANAGLGQIYNDIGSTTTGQILIDALPMYDLVEYTINATNKQKMLNAGLEDEYDKAVETYLQGNSWEQHFAKQKALSKVYGEFRYESIMQQVNNVEEYITGDIPDYIKAQAGYQIAEAFGELPSMAIGLIPFVGMPLLGATSIGRYYQEALEETGGDRAAAVSYTTIFGTLGFLINKYTLNLGKGFLQKMPTPNRSTFLLKQMGIGFKGGSITSFGEFLTEMAESAYLQQWSKGEIDWKQARWEGFLAAIVGFSGAQAVTTVRGALGVKHINNMLEVKWSENHPNAGQPIFSKEEAIEIVDDINNGNLDAANKKGMAVMDQYFLDQTGANVLPRVLDSMRIGKYHKYTLGRINAINKIFTDNEIIEEVDRLVNEDNEIKNWQDEAKEAFINPTRENLKILNKKIVQIAKENKAFTENIESVILKERKDKAEEEEVKLTEYNDGDIVIYNNNEVKIIGKLKKEIDGKATIEYELDSGETVSANDLSIRQKVTPIEEKTIDDIVSDLSDQFDPNKKTKSPTDQKVLEEPKINAVEEVNKIINKKEIEAAENVVRKLDTITIEDYLRSIPTEFYHTNMNLHTLVNHVAACYVCGIPFSVETLNDFNELVNDSDTADIFNREVAKQIKILKQNINKISPNLNLTYITNNNPNIFNSIYQDFIKEIYIQTKLGDPTKGSRKVLDSELIMGSVNLATDNITYDDRGNPRLIDSDYQHQVKNDRRLQYHLELVSRIAPSFRIGDIQGVSEALTEMGFEAYSDFYYKMTYYTEELNLAIKADKNSPNRNNEQLKRMFEEFSIQERAAIIDMISKADDTYHTRNDSSGALNKEEFITLLEQAYGSEIVEEIPNIVELIKSKHKGVKPKSTALDDVQRMFGAKIVEIQEPEQEEIIDSENIEFGKDNAELDPIDQTTLQSIEVNAKIELQNLLNRLPSIETLDEATQEKFLNYILYKQGYETVYNKEQDKDIPITPVEDKDLPNDLLAYIKEAQVIFDEIADQIDEIKESVGIDFERLSWYFPLKRNIESQKGVGNIESIVSEIAGFSKTRTGDTKGIVTDPIYQVTRTLDEMTFVLEIAKRKNELLSNVKEKTIEIAEAVDKFKEVGISLEDDIIIQEKIKENILTSEEVELVKLQKELQLVEDIAQGKAKIDMERSGESTYQYINRVNLHQKDGGGQDVGGQDPNVFPEGTLRNWLAKKGQTWANFVDPHFVVQKMDNLKMITMRDREGKLIEVPANPDKRIYGANARLWQQVLRTADRARQQDMVYLKLQMALMADYKTEGDLNHINKLLADTFLGKDISGNREYVLKAIDEKKIAEGLKIPLKDAQVLYVYGKWLTERQNRIALGKKRRSKLSQASADQKKRFYELEDKIEKNTITETELNEYKSYAKLADKEDGKYIVRKVTRWLFEQKAINDKDFFGWFEGTMSQATKGAYFDNLIIQIEAWANYLESIGQNANAKWWRNKIHSNILGNLYDLEDQILTYTIGKFQGFVSMIKGEEFTGDEIEKAKAQSIENIKLGIIDSLTWLQKARINAFLLGNIGWSLNTQPSSIAFVVKQVGFSETLKAINGEIFADKDSSVINKLLTDDEIVQSNVVSLKSIGQEIAGIEAIDFAEKGVKKTKRQQARNIMGKFGGLVEDRLTRVAYTAGYNHAKHKMFLNEDDAQIHGDFVAATTQSMYDRITRNSGLNTQFLRLMRPMQSYVFTAFSNALDSMGAVGRQRDVRIRAREMARWILTQRMWAVIWSMIFGDDLLKALYNPTFDKGTWGSNIPLFGLQVDIWISKAIPWIDNKGWMGDEAGEQFLKATTRIIYAAATNQENWEREAIIYGTRYITPAIGIGGSVPLINLTKLMWAASNDDSFEDIKGKEYEKFQYNNPIGWSGGILFGTKAVDERESTKKERKKKE